ncbi:unnamed protein product [Malus baccata var. baccata]
MAKKEASSSNSVATWNAHNTSIFCDDCIKDVEAGHCPSTHFDKDGYANIKANFKAETMHDYERKQLKNKWDALKNEWKLWKELVGKEIGLGWNSRKGTVDASEEWWNNKIQNMENCKKKGISPEMEDKLDMMFSSKVATGEPAWHLHLEYYHQTVNQGELRKKKVDKKGKKLEVLQNFVVKLTVLLKHMKLGVLQTH